MSIYNKVRAVEKVFRHLDKELETFRQKSGMSCITGCGRCCQKPDIEATPLEFLPLAYALQKEGIAMEWYEDLKSNPASQRLCAAYKPLHPFSDNPSESYKGSCGQYQYRGLICRLFGFTAARDKLGFPQLVTCQTIKTTQPDSFKNGQQLATEGKIVFMRDYYFQLASIDPQLGNNRMPINLAILNALEYVISYYLYRKPLITGNR